MSDGLPLRLRPLRLNLHANTNRNLRASRRIPRNLVAPRRLEGRYRLPRVVELVCWVMIRGPPRISGTQSSIEESNVHWANSPDLPPDEGA
jgi:hypothetical protein